MVDPQEPGQFLFKKIQGTVGGLGFLEMGHRPGEEVKNLWHGQSRFDGQIDKLGKIPTEKEIRSRKV